MLNLDYQVLSDTFANEKPKESESSRAAACSAGRSASVSVFVQIPVPVLGNWQRSWGMCAAMQSVTSEQFPPATLTIFVFLKVGLQVP